MSYYSTTPLPYYPSGTEQGSIEYVVFELWNRYLNIEVKSDDSNIKVKQQLEVISFVIDYWEEKLSEINMYEIQKRRSNSNKNS